MTAFEVRQHGTVQVNQQDLERELLKYRATASFVNACVDDPGAPDRDAVTIRVQDGTDDRYAFITDEVTSRYGGTQVLLLTDKHAEHIGYLVNMKQPEQAIKYVVEPDDTSDFAEYYIVGLGVTVTAEDSRARI